MQSFYLTSKKAILSFSNFLELTPLELLISFVIRKLIIYSFFSVTSETFNQFATTTRKMLTIKNFFYIAVLFSFHWKLFVLFNMNENISVYKITIFAL